MIATAQNVAPPCATGIGGIAGAHNSGYRQEISAEDSSEHSAWKHLQRPCPEEGTIMQTNCQAWPMQEDELEVSLIVNRAAPRGDKLDENHARTTSLRTQAQFFFSVEFINQERHKGKYMEHI